VTDGRAALLEIFRAAVDAVGGRRAVARFLDGRALEGPVFVVAIGKAAADMALGASDVLGESIQATLVITKEGHLDGLALLVPGYELIEAAHPIPDARSLEAGQRLVGFLEGAPADARFLFLISGGASSLVEHLTDDLDVEFLQRMNTWLLGSGLPIDAMNRVRKACSTIKGGGLIRHLQGRPALNLLISDVPGDDPAVIGSGLLVPDKSVALPELPDWLAQVLAGPSSAASTDAAGAQIETHIVASRVDAIRGAAGKAHDLGLEVSVAEGLLEGDALEAGRKCARDLLRGPSGVRIWSGETTVTLPADPGRGGRNQALALAAAGVIEGEQGVWLLAAGTDGTDGPTEDAGALVDGATVMRGHHEGLDPEQALARADSGRFLAASGDLIHTGPTGTNVMDLVIGLKAVAGG
jgi:glycerate 2-kinase